ncbi:uncharacterized protein V1510DRAFT_406566 [Dipodascopsis tothii]|uniref:uncharacterized protein n=1 Tax=Dipodascopsis tothii TaxID=44089 RepID=UPI0034CDD68F
MCADREGLWAYMQQQYNEAHDNAGRASGGQRPQRTAKVGHPGGCQPDGAWLANNGGDGIGRAGSPARGSRRRPSAGTDGLPGPTSSTPACEVPPPPPPAPLTITGNDRAGLLVLSHIARGRPQLALAHVGGSYGLLLGLDTGPRWRSSTHGPGTWADSEDGPEWLRRVPAGRHYRWRAQRSPPNAHQRRKDLRGRITLLYGASLTLALGAADGCRWRQSVRPPCLAPGAETAQPQRPRQRQPPDPGPADAWLLLQERQAILDTDYAPLLSPLPQPISRGHPSRWPLASATAVNPWPAEAGHTDSS